MPRSLGAAAESILGVRGDPQELQAILDRSSIPMTLYDDERRYVEVNRPAQLMARLSLAEIRRLTLDDLTPPDELPMMKEIWARMVETGFVTGPRRLAGRNGAWFEIVYWGMAEVLPGLHMFAFAPADWSEDELGVPDDEESAAPPAPLTPREGEVLQLAAEGLTGPRIAERLVVSPATVKTHFQNIYGKLCVPSRVAAVAKGMRLGLIS